MFLFVHIDTDSKQRTFEANGFPSNWDSDFSKVDLAHLIDELQKRLNDKHVGVIISFPTTYIFKHDRLIEATKLGVTPVILWGKKENCLLAKKERLEKKGCILDSNQLKRYDKQNNLTFQTYDRSEYKTFKIEAFQEDGTRYSDEIMFAQIMRLTE